MTPRRSARDLRRAGVVAVRHEVSHVAASVSHGETERTVGLLLAKYDRDARTKVSLPKFDGSQETTRSVPAPTDDAIDVIVDAVSSGARISRATDVGSPSDSTSAVTLPQTRMRRQSMLARRSAALLLAFVIGLGLAIWSLRALDPSRPDSVSATSDAPAEPAPAPSREAIPATPPPLLASRDLRPLAALAFSVRGSDVGDAIASRDAIVDAPASPAARPPLVIEVAPRANVPPRRTRTATNTTANATPAPVDVAPEPLDSVAAMPAPAAWPPVASVDRESVDLEAVETSAVRGTIDGYARALERLDVQAAARLWPSVDRRALTRAFSSLKSQDVAFDDCIVDLESVTATARCTGTAQYVARIGPSGPRTGRFEWLFQMRKHDDEWKIEAVNASTVGSRDQD